MAKNPPAAAAHPTCALSRTLRRVAVIGALAASCLQPCVTAAPVQKTAIASGAYFNLDPMCDPKNAPLPPVCTGQVHAELVYIDPDPQVFNALDKSAVVSFKLYTNGGGFKFQFPLPDPAGQFIDLLNIQESEDFFAVGFFGHDLDVETWMLAKDGSFDFVSHGEEIMGHAGALVWKVPEPGTLLLCAVALAALLGQRRAQLVSAKRPAPPRRSPRS